jgi:exoribonuclease-2
MLPWPLTRARLSLDAGVDRRVVSLVARVRDDGTLDGPPELVRGIARVDRRLTYEQSLELPDEWREPFPVLERLAATLKRGRLDRGALALDLPDLKITIDDAGEPQLSQRRPDTPGHVVVSELMVVFNHAVATRLAAARAAALYRVQPEPVSIAVSPEDPLFAIRARRGLSPTLVEVDPGPHRTIGLDVYLQASSPIRRYGDLIAQRQLAAILEGRPPAYGRDEVLALKTEIERAERTARRIEADRDLYWICRWLEHHRQETFEAVVSRAPEHGRGLVFVPALTLELPLGDPDEALVIAEGERVRVRVRRASPRKRSTSFEVVVETPPTS